MLELFFDSSLGWNSSQKKQVRTGTATRSSFAIYAVQFAVSVLSFGAGRTGCCYTITPLHIALCLSKKSWQNNRSLFCYTLRSYLISHHEISFSFPV
jgi:hypothetical protein